jgi:hypothetical protein
MSGTSMGPPEQSHAFHEEEQSGRQKTGAADRPGQVMGLFRTVHDVSFNASAGPQYRDRPAGP